VQWEALWPLPLRLWALKWTIFWAKDSFFGFEEDFFELIKGILFRLNLFPLFKKDFKVHPSIVTLFMTLSSLFSLSHFLLYYLSSSTTLFLCCWENSSNSVSVREVIF
jgi:hypothetical protein